MMIVFALTGVRARAQDHQHAKPTSNAASEKLKGLAGRWSANTMKPEEKSTCTRWTATH
jgi:hypothetical protein